MAAKITLTGRPTGPIVETSQYFRFEMEEGGSPAPPKGLPSASVMAFSVFVAKKAGKKLGFPRLPAQRLLVQGELVADLSLSECPGEIGVIAFKIEELLPKEDRESGQESAVPAPPIRPAAVPRQPSAGSGPNLSAYPVVPLEQIAIPDAFLRTPPSAPRTAELQAQIREQGQLDEPLVVERTVEPLGYLLKDGYRRYLIARQLGWTMVPVQVEADAVSRGKPPK